MRTLTILSTVLAALPLVGTAAVTQIAVSGWNEDMVINDPAPYDASVTGTMDGGFSSIENNTWVEAGTYENAAGSLQSITGLVAGTHSSLTGSGTFTFQSFSGNNVVGLDTTQTSATLTLDSAARYTSIALYGATGAGTASMTITLNFSDSSTTDYFINEGEGICSDWFDGDVTDRAYDVGARAANKSEEGYTRLFLQENSAIGLHESLLTLSAGDQLKDLESVTFTNTGAARTAVFAISGEEIPEPTSLTFLGLAGALGIIRRRRR